MRKPTTSSTKAKRIKVITKTETINEFAIDNTVSHAVEFAVPADDKPAVLDDPVRRYALDVVEGRETAGPNVRMACARHLRDLETCESRGFYWDWAAADRALRFFPAKLRLAGGEFEGRPFILHPAQKFIVGSIFGWKDKDGSRRFRVAYIEMGKGNGKSPLAAGIGLYMLTSDREYRAEIYSAAVDKEQARVLFRDAVAMVDQSEELKSLITKSGGKDGDVTRVWNLAYLRTGSFFRPIASESTGRGKSGPRPHCAILDEVHEHPTNAMVEFMRAGTKGRRQALILMITNSGVNDPTSVCYQYHHFAERVLQQLEHNEHFFAYVCGLDEGDDWADPKVWPKANPLLGISITFKYLEEVVHDGLGMPSKQSIIQRLNFCAWVDSASPFLEAHVLKANNVIVDKESLTGRSCVGGIDLSGKNDLSSITLLFDEDEEGKRDVLSFYWTPADTVKQRSLKDKAPYQEWIDAGLIEATPGRSINYDFIAVKMGELVSEYDVKAFAFDRHRMDDLEKALEDMGLGQIAVEGDIKLVHHAQGFNDMDPSIEVLEDYFLDTKLRLGDNAVTTWCIQNVKVEQNAMLLRMFSKRLSTGRIDGATSLALAAGISKSFQESGGDYSVTVIE